MGLKKLIKQCLLVAIALLGVIHTQASKHVLFKAMPQNLEYKSEGKDSLNPIEYSEVHILDEYLESNGFQALLDNSLNRESLFSVEQAYWDSENERSIFLKLDVSPTDSNLLNFFLTDRDSFLYHSKFESGLHFALYFDGFNPDQAEQHVSRLQNLISRKKNTRLHPFNQTLAHLNPVSNAYAASGFWNRFRSSRDKREKNHPQEPKLSHTTPTPSSGKTSEQMPAASNSPQQQEALADSVPLDPNSASIAQKVLACTKGIGQSTYDATIGLAIKITKGAYSLIRSTAWGLRHPVQAWRRTKQRFQDFAQLIKTTSKWAAYDVGIGHKDDKISGLKSGLAESPSASKGTPSPKSVSPSKYSQLTSAQKINFVCKLITQVGITGATWYFSAVNSAALSEQVLAFFEGSNHASRANTGRTLFMETQYAEMNKKFGEKHKAQKQEQVELAKKWARENPKEAAAIIKHYESKS